MDIDKINDINILKDKLKKLMTICKKSFNKNGSVFQENEYYYVDQDEDSVYIYDDNDNLIVLSYDEAEEYLS